MVRPRKKLGPRPALARKLIAAREKRGLTQARAAAELGIATSRLASFESGAREPGSLALLALRAWSAESLGERFSIVALARKGRGR